MSLSDVPDDIFLIIVKKLGDEDFCYLGPIIRSNTRGRDIGLCREVLNSANISTLCNTPANIFPGGVGREFFTRCLVQQNVTATYFESLRLITREHDIHGSISLLQHLVPAYGHATLAYAMFQMCAGRGEIAGYVFDFIFDNFSGPLSTQIYSPHLDEMCQRLIDTLIKFDPPCEDTFGPTWEFASSDVLGIPTCLEVHDEDFYCEGCYIYNCALRISEML